MYRTIGVADILFLKKEVASMTTQRLSTLLVVPAVITALAGISYTLFQQQRSLQAVMSQVQIKNEEQPEKQSSVPVEKIVSKSEIWRPIQERVKDTVVQVFSQIAEFDFLEPY